MFIQDDEKDDRKKALGKLKSMMGSETGRRLGSLKNPSREDMASEASEGFQGDDDMEDEGVEEDDEDGDEPSDEDKMKISALYHKFCK